MTTELCYSHIFNTNRLVKHGFAGTKRFRGFRETSPRAECSEKGFVHSMPSGGTVHVISNNII